ncbi:HAMP domain-containing sensor histidine kinase [Kangiella sp. HZ709]|uniref:sensor histidine kinase n=1 Tax=Kangiella sp. HZ709 TaxID=2666328 RepID=UPI0012B0D5D0|nr:HAMP domain-containing sensor histidine kinase [Kangiella sp. HZ709]MRX26755.1 HAMP domain-containing protein [Kangiella sp. HZ709]
MSIRTKLLTLFISLLAILLALQGFLYYQYNDKLSERLGEAAFKVSKDTAGVLIRNQNLLFKSQVYSIDSDGQITREFIQIPSHTNIQITLADDTKDQAIKLRNKNTEYKIPIPRLEVQDTIADLRQQNLWITFLLFAFAIVIVGFLTYSITKPLLALNQAAKKISAGELGTQVKISKFKYGQDVADTIEQFNKMSKDLVEYQKQQLNNQELEHFKELGSISRGLAHNLRNPLNTLQLSLEQLEINHPELTSSHLSSTAKDQVNRIEQWLKSFTLIMEQGIEKQYVSIRHIVNNAVSIYSKEQLKVVYEEDFNVYCVETELVMILQILIQNALESYDDMAKPNIRLSLETKKHDGMISILVTDTGKGISDSIRRSMFKPYNTDKTYGSGMGLFIARRLIKHRYGGDILLEDNKPHGTKIALQISSEIR